VINTKHERKWNTYACCDIYLFTIITTTIIIKIIIIHEEIKMMTITIMLQHHK